MGVFGVGFLGVDGAFLEIRELSEHALLRRVGCVFLVWAVVVFRILRL